MNDSDLDHQQAVATGRAQAIGFAIAKRIIEIGATVTHRDLDAALLQRAQAAPGKSASTAGVDILNRAEGNAARAKTEPSAAPLDAHDIVVKRVTPATARTGLAALVVWLLSRENGFTTASVFDLSGGRATC